MVVFEEKMLRGVFKTTKKLKTVFLSGFVNTLKRLFTARNNTQWRTSGSTKEGKSS